MTHYVPGADTNHFLGRCEECDAHYLSGRTLEEVERWYWQGMISQDQWEAYGYVWATSAWRSDHWDSWKVPPVIPAVVRIAEIMQGILRERAEKR